MRSVIRALACGSATVVSMSCGGGGGDGTGPDPNAVTTVVVTPASASLNALGATTALSAVARNSAGATVSGKSFSWTSESPSVATVNASTGVVTAAANGTAVIRATVSGGSVSGTATITVQQAVAAMSVQPASGTVIVGRTLQLNATATDAGGAAIASPQLTWTSSSTAVATVSTTGLVTGVAPGTATVTAASGTVTANASITVQPPSLNLTQDTTLSGTAAFNQFVIPAGRTVTVTGPLTVSAAGLVNIAGTITGTCVPVSILGDTAVVISGTVSNGCDAGTEAALFLRSNGELLLEGATITSSGPITLGNSPDHTEAGFPAGLRPASRAVASASAGVRFARVANSTIRYHGNREGGAGPRPAPAGADGNPAGNGQNGRPVALVIDGNALFAGNTTVWGQEGGRGGNSTTLNSSNTVSVQAGHGGRGGKISIFVTGKLTYEGSGNIVRSGRGGDGGAATASTQTNAGHGAKGPNAVATAGNGGEPGLVDIRAGNGIHVAAPGALQIEIFGGDGGAAQATGAKGADATANQAAQEGGDATAFGGRGGNTPRDTLRSAGSVTGSPPVLVDRAGNGGNATARAGDGGKGVKQNKAGARGGTPDGSGGHGGDAQLEFPAGVFVGDGGDAGNLLLRDGNGGDGWDGCTPPEEAGGNGGAGGSLRTQVRGRGGSGGSTGAGSTITYDNVGNGGRGGGGTVPGAGGAAGQGPAGPRQAFVAGDVFLGQNFTAGQDGPTCGIVTPNAPPSGHLFMQIAGWPTNSQGFMGPGTYTRPLLNGPNGSAAGQVLISTIANSFTTYYARTNPPRIGQPGGMSTGWDLNLASVQEGGMFPNIESFAICFLNENPSPGGASGIVVQQRDNFGVVWAEETITGPGGPITDGRAGCRAFGKHLNTTHIRWFRTGAGTTEVDWIAFTKKLTP